MSGKEIFFIQSRYKYANEGLYRTEAMLIIEKKKLFCVYGKRFTIDNVSANA